MLVPLLLPAPDWLLELLPVPPLPRPEPLRKLFVLLVFDPVPKAPPVELEPDVPVEPEPEMPCWVRVEDVPVVP